MAGTTRVNDEIESRAYTQMMDRSLIVSLARRDLSGGGKAGVAIGVILIVVIAVGGTWFFLRKRRAQKQGVGVESATTSELKPSPPPKDKAVPDDKYVLPHIPTGGKMPAPPTAVTASKPDTRPFVPELMGSDTTGVPLAREVPTHYVELDSTQQPGVDRKPSEGSNLVLPIQIPPPLPSDSAPASPLAGGPETQVSIHPGPVPHSRAPSTEPVIQVPNSNGGLPAAVQRESLHDKGSSTV